MTVATAVDRVWTRPGKHTVTVDGDESPRRDVRRPRAGSHASRSRGREDRAAAREPHPGPRLRDAEPLLAQRGRTKRQAAGRLLARRFRPTVSIRILRDGRWVASPHAASYEAGAHRFEWNGVRAVGRLRDGSYAAVVEVSDVAVGAVSVAVPFTSDTTAPRVRLLPGPRSPRRGQRARDPLPHDRRCSEGARGEESAASFASRGAERHRRVRVVARDAAGNTSRPVVRLRDSSLLGE